MNSLPLGCGAGNVWCASIACITPDPHLNPLCRYIIFNLAMSGGQAAPCCQHRVPHSKLPSPPALHPPPALRACQTWEESQPGFTEIGLPSPSGQPQTPLAMWIWRSWPSPRSTRCGTVKHSRPLKTPNLTLHPPNHIAPALAFTCTATSSGPQRLVTNAFSHHWPMILQVDYVRVYQNASAFNLGCSPPAYPTQQYLAW